jgi:hypothetical protein
MIRHRVGDKTGSGFRSWEQETGIRHRKQVREAGFRSSELGTGMGQEASAGKQVGSGFRCGEQETGTGNRLQVRGIGYKEQKQETSNRNKGIGTTGNIKHRKQQQKQGTETSTGHRSTRQHQATGTDINKWDKNFIGTRFLSIYQKHPY